IELPWGAAAMPLRTPKDKICFLDHVRAVAKTRRDIDPYVLARELAHTTGAPDFAPDSELDAKLNPGELRMLAESPMFAIGAHGHTHRILEHLDQAELETEIATSTSLLSG